MSFSAPVAYTEGPHSLLLKCISERRRVRVWTRRYKGLRSVLAGYLVAFDKHMNMVRVPLLMSNQIT